MKMNKPPEFELAPLRTLDDFVLESARFQVPTIRDLDKWGRRVTSNLLYYQTNYFLMSLIIFIIVGVLHPTQMAYGVVTTAIIFGLFTYVTNERAAASQFKRKHPVISILIIVLGAYFVTYMFGSLLIFSLGIFLPISVTFVHASLRLRNIKNKLVNRVETLGIKRTPMGIFLEEFGLEQEVF